MAKPQTASLDNARWRMPPGIVGYGTLLNTFTVAVGALAGLALKSSLPPQLQATVLSGLGLVTVCLAVKMFFASKNVLIVAMAIAMGSIIGTFLGLQNLLDQLGEWAKTQVGAGDSATFTQGFVTASILFCVGPMTLMGCIQEAVERRIELIGVKSTLDLFAAMFLAVSLGSGVLVSAVAVFVIQGLLTLMGSFLAKLAEDERYVAEASGTGGPILLATGLGLLQIKTLPTADFVPALVLAPLLVAVSDRWQRWRQSTHKIGTNA